MTDDELIEAMARAMFKPDQLNRLDIAAAALAVARPIIERETRERCARIADDKGELNVTGFSDYPSGWWDACAAIADAIRETGDE